MLSLSLTQHGRHQTKCLTPCTNKGKNFEAYYVEYGMEYYGSYVDGRDTTDSFPEGKFYPSDMHDDYEDGHT